MPLQLVISPPSAHSVSVAILATKDTDRKIPATRRTCMPCAAISAEHFNFFFFFLKPGISKQEKLSIWIVVHSIGIMPSGLDRHLQAYKLLLQQRMQVRRLNIADPK